MHIGYIGLGKMGRNMVERLLAHTHSVAAYDPDPDARAQVEALGATPIASLTELVKQLPTPRTIWIMVPHSVVQNVLNDIDSLLEEGDTIIEGGNSPFKDSQRRAAHFEKKGIHFLDAGISGGPVGAKNGACIMIGGSEEVYKKNEALFKDIAVEEGYAYVGTHGAGHFVKMVHNGIEYGMMQAIAEGFDIMKHANFKKPLPLTEIAKLYNHGSVIESRLIGWLQDGFEHHGESLDDITGSARASGEGLWTVETATVLGIHTPVIEDAVTVRDESMEKPHYQGKIISVLRKEFGGHDAKK